MSKSSPLRASILMCALIVSVSLLAGDLLGASKGTNRQETQDPPASAQSRPISAGTPADLSGTYTGTINYEEGGLTGDATLTITGDRFTLTSGTQTITGRVTATQWPGYISVAMQLGEVQTPAPGQTATTPTSLSLRARRSGERLTLTAAPGAARQFSFTPAGAARIRGPRPRRGQRATPATPAEPATPADPGTPGEPATPANPATPATPATPADPAMPEPAGTPRGRQTRPRRPAANTNANTATPQVTPTP